VRIAGILETFRTGISAANAARGGLIINSG
jgi:hypothetical protein